jgi:hypothetical protein
MAQVLIDEDQLKLLISESERKDVIIAENDIIIAEKDMILSKYETEIIMTKDIIVKILEVIGLAKNGIIDQSIVTGQGNWLTKVLAAGSSVFFTMQQAKIPGIGAKARLEITEKFAFLEVLKPMLARYNEEHTVNKIEGTKLIKRIEDGK